MFRAWGAGHDSRPQASYQSGAVLTHHAAMQAFFSAWYNLCRKLEAIQRQTSTMAAGLTSKVWSIRELLERAAEI